MSTSIHRPPLAAAALGAVSGLRTFTGPAVLAMRGRAGPGAVRGLLIAAAAGELLGDKLPFIPPRSDPMSLIGRVASGAATGRAIAGPGGASAGAAAAAATTYLSERLRAVVGQRTGIADPLLGLSEDALAAAAAVLAIRLSAPDGARDGEPDGEPETRAPKIVADAARPSRAGAVARGLAAAGVGTAAMTSVQVAYLKAGGGQPSSAPGDLGRRIIKGTLGRRVPRRHDEALNQGMHALYGTSWGLPFGLVAGTLRQPPRTPVAGAALGLAAWGTSLIQLPALGLAPAPWRQPASALAGDLGFHLVFGAATVAAYRAFGG